jgi:hypothetical protein
MKKKENETKEQMEVAPDPNGFRTSPSLSTSRKQLLGSSARNEKAEWTKQKNLKKYLECLLCCSLFHLTAFFKPKEFHKRRILHRLP